MIRADRSTEHALEPLSVTDWPVLEPVALHGLAGDIVEALDEYTEADKAAVLFNVLAMFGTFVGPKPRMIVDGSIHTARSFVVVVGNTSRARKSTATAQTRRLFADVDEDWCDDGIRSGFASGEALIKELAEAEDPRCLIVEPEFATVLARAGRDGSILSMTMRNTWDGDAVANRRASGSFVAKDHHVGVIAQTTREELQRQLSATEQANGFGNRFLFVAAKRSKYLADAPTPPDKLYKDLARRIAAAATKAQGIGVMKRSEDGRLAWEEIYNNIDDDVHGIHGALVARAEAQMLRLQMLYALLDGSSEISLEHVAAARAAWDYCEQSVQWAFGYTLGDPTADKLYAALLAAGPDGLTRTEQSKLFGGNKTAAELDTVRRVLNRRHLTRREKTRRDIGAGRLIIKEYAWPLKLRVAEGGLNGTGKG